jgi:microcystin-dependent protein
MDPFVGEIRAVGFNFAPLGWAMCNGQLLPITQNTALFSLLGTFYGGDGRTTFGLPNLQARFPLDAGDTAGLTSYPVGEADGTNTVTLPQSQMPQHIHPPLAAGGGGSTNSPAGGVWAEPRFGRSVEKSYSTTGGTAQMSPSALGNAGSGQPHNNLPPYLVVNFIIAMQGIYPPRG